MTNIVRILHRAGEGDLFWMNWCDTDPAEGAALAMSILDHLYSAKISTMATTHYSELKLYAISRDGIENASVDLMLNSVHISLADWRSWQEQCF